MFIDSSVADQPLYLFLGSAILNVLDRVVYGHWPRPNLTLNIKAPTVSLVKSLLAIFFSVVLVVSQAASFDGPLTAGGQKASTPKCCVPGHPCKSSDCCVRDNGSGSEPSAPAVPSHSSSQNDLQVFEFASLLVWQQRASESAIVPASLILLPSVAAPLYQRNCSYLI